MALRFRRSMKIAPGVRLNIGKKGGSVRLGPRGSGVTLGTSGTRVSAGIPGSGLHVSEKLGSGKRERRELSGDGSTPETRAGFGTMAIGVVLVVVTLVWLLA